MQQLASVCILWGVSSRSEASFVTFSPDGRKVLAAFSEPRMARLWCAQSGDLLRILQGHKDSVTFGSFSFDGKMVLTVSADATAKLWATAHDRVNGKCLHTLRCDGHFDVVAEFSADGRIVLTANISDFVVKIWRANSGECLRTMTLGNPNPEPLPFLGVCKLSPSGQLILTVGDFNGAPKLWCANSGDWRHTLGENGHHYVGCLPPPTFSPDGELVLTGNGRGTNTLKLWSAITGSCVHKLSVPRARRGITWDDFSYTEFSADGQVLLAASPGGAVHLWSASSGEFLQTLRNSGVEWVGYRLSPDSGLVLTSYWHGALELWCVRSGECVQTLTGHRLAASEIAVTLFRSAG